jgi:hypothetical protein
VLQFSITRPMAAPPGAAHGDGVTPSARAARLELATALLLAFATLGSAWSAYQAARWSGEQAGAYSRASALRAESIRASERAFQLSQIDVTTFVVWALARGQENMRVADFLRERFRRELLPAFERWRGLGRAKGEIPQGTPFDLPEYRPAAYREAERLTNQAEAAAAEALHANQLSDNFVFAVVLFTTGVFFAGIQTKTSAPWLQNALLGLSAALLLGASLFMLRLPQNIGF